jgi:uncharacterized ion transporter superfamily protein YfcC
MHRVSSVYRQYRPLCALAQHTRKRYALGSEERMPAHDDTHSAKAGRPATKSFLASMAVLAALMLAAGFLGQALPSGSYERSALPGGGSAVIPGSYAPAPRPDYPAWRLLTAPLEVLAGEDAALAVVIIAFIIIVGGAFALLKEAGVLEASVQALARRFGARRKRFLAVVCLFFMLIGSFMGIFEEVVPLVPLAVSLALSFGWDAFTGLGMSVLAVGFGFSAAIANPFSIGSAQKLAGLPVLSGAPFRIASFALIYALYIAFMLSYVNALEKKRAAKPSADGTLSERDAQAAAPRASSAQGQATRGVRFFAWSGAALALAVLASSLTGIGSDYVLPAIALGFLIIGIGAGLSSGIKPATALKAFARGSAGVAPAGILILMALSVKQIIVAAGVMDTILHGASELLGTASGYGAAGLMYGVTLVMNFFIGSASAKAFLLMPILAPLADLAGLSRQIAVQAFAFGDGFSNMLYPTNAVLLISLGLAGMSWGSWLRRTWKLQLATLLLTLALLMLAVAIGYS